MAKAKGPQRLMLEDIDNRFAFHPATKVTGPLHDGVRQDARRLATKWAKTLPPGRHLAMALTSLQEAMWAANAAVACDRQDDTHVGRVDRLARPARAKSAAPRASVGAARGAGASKKKTTPRRRVTRQPSS